MTTRGVVIGLDGAAWHLTDPYIEAGLMPRLKALKQTGSSGVLLSTVPTYTPPAWTSAVTGVNPGRHGIYGFHDGHAQWERTELMHSGKIKAPTIWEIVNAQGLRAGVFNLPITYPPQSLEGWMVSGMMTPSYGGTQRGFVSPPDHEKKLLGWVPDYVIDIRSHYERDFKDDALARRALEVVGMRRRALEGLLETDPPDLLFTVVETPDRLQHVYYRYMDPSDPLYDSPEARKVRPVLEDCFSAIDEVIGLLHDYAGSDGGVLVCSDHGFTAWEVSVHTNALLERWGYLSIKGIARAMQTNVARAGVQAAKKFLPAKVARDAKGRTFAAVDWSKTRAFASRIPQQGVHINLKGRERLGIVDPSELQTLKDEIAARFEELAGPDGRPATDRVWRSEEVFSGDHLEGAPDLLPVLRDHRFELDDEVFHRDPFTDVSDLPRGVHHPDGMLVIKGPGARAGSKIGGSVIDVTPTILYMAGCDVPEDLDGAVLKDAFEASHLKDNPISTTASMGAGRRVQESPYSAEEEAEIEESLRGLGYL